MADTPRITGLILAGGAGQRVGGQDKGLLPWHGRPLVAHVIECLRPQVGRLLVSCNRNREQYAALAGGSVVADRRRDYQGPLAGLEAAIPLIEDELLLIAPCDTPCLPADLSRRLLDALLRHPDAAIAYAHDGERAQYLCALLRRDCLPSLHGYLDAGHRTVRHWYREHRCEVVDFSDRRAGFRNHNRLV